MPSVRVPIEQQRATVLAALTTTSSSGGGGGGGGGGYLLPDLAVLVWEYTRPTECMYD